MFPEIGTNFSCRTIITFKPHKYCITLHFSISILKIPIGIILSVLLHSAIRLHSLFSKFGFRNTNKHVKLVLNLNIFGPKCVIILALFPKHEATHSDRFISIQELNTQLDVTSMEIFLCKFQSYYHNLSDCLKFYPEFSNKIPYCFKFFFKFQCNFRHGVCVIPQHYYYYNIRLLSKNLNKTSSEIENVSNKILNDFSEVFKGFHAKRPNFL